MRCFIDGSSQEPSIYDTLLHMRKTLGKEFFSRPTVLVARELLGKYLIRKVNRVILAGKITDVEAYCGENDLACHASKGRTKRTEVLYGAPGILYVYLIYGMYWCLNIVAERKGYPAAVLIRAVEPVSPNPKIPGILTLTNGPGKLCRTFNITGDLHAKRMGRGTLWIEDRGERISRSQIIASPRVGVEYAKHCTQYPWRFLLKS